MRAELPQAVRVQDSEQLFVHALAALVVVADADTVPVAAAQLVRLDGLRHGVALRRKRLLGGGGGRRRR